MKTKNIFIIAAILIAAALAYWYFKKHKEDTSEYEGKDTSDYADVAEISTKKALQIAKKHSYVYILCDSENREDPTVTPSLYEMSVGTDHIHTKHYWISKQTFEALIDAGYEPDYN